MYSGYKIGTYELPSKKKKKKPNQTKPNYFFHLTVTIWRNLKKASPKLILSVNQLDII